MIGRACDEPACMCVRVAAFFSNIFVPDPLKQTGNIIADQKAKLDRGGGLVAPIRGGVGPP